MTTLFRNTLTYVWFFLTAITVVSWWISRSSGTGFSTDALITVSVLSIAAVKAHFVIWYFMEVRLAPDWLKRTVSGWLIILVLLLIGFYFAF